MADVFLTYAPADAELALRIAKGLERAGLSVTRGPTQFGNDWAVRVFDALDASSAVVALWSRDAMTRDWIASEAAIAAHFGQLVSIRVDPSLARDQIPAGYLESDGSVIDIFESDIAPNGWSQASAEVLDRSLAPVSGKVRALKARGPVAAPIVEAGAVAPAEHIVAALNPHFTYSRRDGLDKAAKTSPAMAATKRASAFRGAYAALEAIDFPADVRVGLVDFAVPETADRGLARLYAEALSRNDKEFWGHVGRVALPLSGSLALACFSRGGEAPGVVAELIEPRDPREMYGERFGRGRGRSGGGSRGNVVMWPVAVVALGVAALVAMPQVSKLMTSEPGTPSSTTADSGDAPSYETAETPQPVVVPIRQDPPRDLASIPLESTAASTTVKAVETAPSPTVAVARAAPLPPPPVQTAMAPPAPSRPFGETSATPQLQAASATVEQPQQRLRYCRLEPGPAEFTVEVMPSEDLFEVAERVALGSKEGLRKIAERNSGCLGARTLTLADGRLLSGRNLIFPGDRLVIPVYSDTQAAAVTVTPAVAPPL